MSDDARIESENAFHDAEQVGGNVNLPLASAEAAGLGVFVFVELHAESLADICDSAVNEDATRGYVFAHHLQVAGLGPGGDLGQILRIGAECRVELGVAEVVSLCGKLVVQVVQRRRALAWRSRIRASVDAHLDAALGIGFLEKLSLRDCMASTAGQDYLGDRLLFDGIIGVLALHEISFRSSGKGLVRGVYTSLRRSD